MSLSDLDEGAIEREFIELSKMQLKVHRFRTPDEARHYMALRRNAEDKTRTKFIEKGGLPILRHPRYMVLGTSKWFTDWYVEKREIRIPLNCFDSSTISFTYPDCLISMILAESPKWESRRRPYHGNVYTLQEIGDVIATFGMPDESDPARFEIDEHLIEAQIWDIEPLKRFLPEVTDHKEPN